MVVNLAHITACTETVKTVAKKPSRSSFSSIPIHPALLAPKPEPNSRSYIEEEDTGIRMLDIESNLMSDGSYAKYFKASNEELSKMKSDERGRFLKAFISLFKKMERLIEVNSALSLDGDVEGSIESFLDTAHDLIEADDLVMFKVDPVTKMISRYLVEEDTKFPPGYGLVGYSVEKLKLLNVSKPNESPEFREDIDISDPLSPNSLLILPIRKEDSVCAVLVASKNRDEDSKARSFSDEDEFLFRQLGSTLSAIMNNGNLYDSMMNTRKKVTVLLETTKSLSSILDLNKLIDMIMESAKELLSSERCTLFLHDPERKQLRAIIQVRDSVQEIRIPSTAGIAGAVFTSGVPINITNAYEDDRFNKEVDRQTGFLTRTVLCIPIRNLFGQVIGVTQLINKKVGIYDAEDEMILNSFSSQAAVAIEKSQLFKKTEDMRAYLQSILSSITSCVITLSESMHLVINFNVRVPSIVHSSWKH